ncbi:MAG: aspartate dehydrogenase [Methanoregulaceae archaeon]|nr:aspartate dehydrogenase [Methanoregulaceae archaeon]
MIRIGLLGCGNIGQIIAKHRGKFEITALFDKIFQRAVSLADLCGSAAYEDFDTFVHQDFDLVVEAASVQAVKLYAGAVLESGKDLVIMSVGALSEVDFRERLVRKAEARARRIHVPSGAIFGLDNLKVGQISKIDKLILRTTKSPSSLGIAATERIQIFSGKANECIKAFPKNVNVSVALGLAARRDADVELWVDPEVDRNVHEIFAEGDFGDAYIRVRNVQSPDNPATSYLAALSILTLLENLDSSLVIGT